MSRILPWVSVCLFAGAAGRAQAHDFLGPESCQSCHVEAYAQWRSSAHARARTSLTPVQQRDARCLTCHSPNEGDQRVQGVSCETCHGGGKYYSTTYVMKDSELSRLLGLVDPTEKACRSCHEGSAPSLKPFEFVARLKAMDHWSSERSKRTRKHPK